MLGCSSYQRTYGLRRDLGLGCSHRADDAQALRFPPARCWRGFRRASCCSRTTLSGRTRESGQSMTPLSGSSFPKTIRWCCPASPSCRQRRRSRPWDGPSLISFSPKKVRTLLAARSLGSVRADVPTGWAVAPDSARPIHVGPELLVYLDQARRASFLRQWRRACRADEVPRRRFGKPNSVLDDGEARNG